MILVMKMKRLKNKEFRMAIQNLLSSEEHIIDMLNIKNQNFLVDLLRDVKLQRNLMLDFPEEKDRNRWCALKHIILSQYHILEMINNKEFKNIENLNIAYKELDKIIEKYIDEDFETDCDICVKDLIIDKVKKAFIK